MLDYDWENQSTFMFPSDETTQDQNDQNNNQFLDTHPHFSSITNYHQPQPQPQQQLLSHQFSQFQTTPNNINHFSSLYEPRAYGVSYTQTHEPSMLSLQPTGSSTGYMVVPKSEPQFMGGPIHDFSSTSSRIGLNLGGRTYFASSSDDDFVNRLYRRTRAVEAGSVNSPKCQAEGCNADLTHAKHYHRRHKVCEFHSKAATVIAAGLTQRFCQQCSRGWEEVDPEGICVRKFMFPNEFATPRFGSMYSPNSITGKEVAGNGWQITTGEGERMFSKKNNKKQPLLSTESGANSSTVTVAIPPPRISVDCFRQRTYQQAAATTSSATFFSNG